MSGRDTDLLGVVGPMTRGARLAAVGVAFVLGVAMACTSPEPAPSREPAAPPRSPAPEIRWPTEGWPTITPESEGFDSVELAGVVEDLRARFSEIHSPLIVREGSVVLDAYAYPYDRSLYHDLASVTKSVTTTLIGIAATQGLLDLDAPVLSFFPDRAIANLDERKERITARDLLSMSSGLDCGDWPYEVTQREMRQSADYVGFVLDLEMAAEPGTTFSYCSPGMHLLSAILTQATGVSALEFARANLFDPLGIEDVYWPADPQGVTTGGAISR